MGRYEEGLGDGYLSPSRKSSLSLQLENAVTVNSSCHAAGTWYCAHTETEDDSTNSRSVLCRTHRFLWPFFRTKIGRT